MPTREEILIIKGTEHPEGFNPVVIRWVNSFASCAIEGNAEAKRMIDLWDTDKPEFYKELRKWEEKT